ncbi:PhzF family phenazine biosynthesis protein [Alkaliflexus imshenetskii]|uniref:PhzF family phenazine biosynthesis protein n=1 Tax=Alkaliflexus imshenetskii TaxID=286730 RepID=UPI000479D66D|nr:PhzF family phenazine biosynthesis protein [Alkaliflexus imshenetskii]
MKKLKLYQVDAFTDRLFAGNPAAVCILDEWLDEAMMQNISAENNLAETAFIVPRHEYCEIRWFTPTIEVDLCGHATLASAHVLLNILNPEKSAIQFIAPRAGTLFVTQENDILYLDFPTDTLRECNIYTHIEECIGQRVKRIYKGKTDYIALLGNEKDVLAVEPNLQEIAKLQARGLIVTAAGNDVDFVSRFFAPQSGIDEDPVTGSAHTSLIPLWAGILNKKEMTALQLSKRGGKLLCVDNGDRCLIGGNARLYLTGEIYID